MIFPRFFSNKFGHSIVFNAMKRTLWLFVLIGLAGFHVPLSAAQTSAAVEYKKVAGTFVVEIARYDWSDTKRDRKVPVKIYYPKGPGPFPIIIFSHGLGGSREGYEYLGQHWASYGYVSVHLQHIGSDRAVWEGVQPAEIMQKMRDAAMNLDNAANRPKDVSFAIDQLEKMNREDSNFKGRLDLTRIGVGGHSFGAFTALAIAGQTFGGERGNVSFVDPRVKAVIAMSAPVTPNQARVESAFDRVKVPCFHMTGTRDSSPIGETRPEDRRIPFDRCHTSDQYLVIFKDGDHMVFSGRGGMRGGEKDALYQSYIRVSSVAFWDAYLKEDAKAKKWLTGNGFQATLGSDGTFEKKLNLALNSP